MKFFNSGVNSDISEADVSSIFLAGPTLRGRDKELYLNWRDDAVNYLQELNFSGHVYVPEPLAENKSEQIDWEVYHLEKAKCILFWVPRNLTILPGFTTNIEFGEWMRSGKIVLGVPEDAVKVSYMVYRAKKYGVPVFDNLKQTVETAIKMSKS